MIRPVETQQTRREVEHGAIGAFDGRDPAVSAVRFTALVAKPKGVASVFLELQFSVRMTSDFVYESSSHLP